MILHWGNDDYRLGEDEEHVILTKLNVDDKSKEVRLFFPKSSENSQESIDNFINYAEPSLDRMIENFFKGQY